jgi:hypothetical protein
MTIEVAVVAIAGMVTFLAFIGMLSRAEIAKAKASGASNETVTKLEGIVAETSAEVGKLKDRVRVLERLVTDDDRKLAGEIESLRKDNISPGA